MTLRLNEPLNTQQHIGILVFPPRFVLEAELLPPQAKQSLQKKEDVEKGLPAAPSLFRRRDGASALAPELQTDLADAFLWRVIRPDLDLRLRFWKNPTAVPPHFSLSRPLRSLSANERQYAN